MANITTSFTLPPLPDYTARPIAPMIPGIPDKISIVVLPVIVYWIYSGFFTFIDHFDLFSKYRLHTPAEVLKRNRVSFGEVLREVFIQHVIQMVVGIGISFWEPDDMTGMETYNVHLWARRIRLAQRMIPSVLAMLGVDALAIARAIQSAHPMIAGILAGGQYPSITQEIVMNGKLAVLPAFTSWELNYAKLVYWLAIPIFKFVVAVCFIDTWQYFLHRAMHMNQYLYKTLHSRHHRLYVPYAFGALYNHPIEGFLLDTVGASLAFKLSGMSIRQGTFLFCFSECKTVDDHCGYALPFDPFQVLFPNNATYHDVHHQSWGIKTNFSQPFFTFWDHILGTAWTGGDISARYARSSELAQKMLDKDKDLAKTKSTKPYTDAVSVVSEYINELDALHVPNGTKAAAQAGESRDQVLSDSKNGGMDTIVREIEEEVSAEESSKVTRRSPRKKGGSGRLSVGSTDVTGLRGLRVMGVDNHS